MAPPMQSPRDYLTYLTKVSRARHDAWWLVSEQTGTPESRRAKLLATLRFFGQEQRATELETLLAAEPLKSSLTPDLRDVVNQTAQDLEEYVLPEEIEVFRRTVFGLLPLSAVDGFCVDRTPWGAKLDGYLVVLNEGLFICAQLLAKAFLLENLDGDLLEFKQPGIEPYRRAIEHFLAPSAKHANSVLFEGVPPDIEGALSAAQMRMTILLLQFVLLHEVGHAVHQDHALMSEYQFHVAGTQATAKQTDRHWSAEYAADGYALERILRHTEADASRWANFVAVYVFFHWLGTVERVTGKPLCPLHPPPAMRGEALRSAMSSRVPLDSQTAVLVDRSFEILDSWARLV